MSCVTKMRLVIKQAVINVENHQSLFENKRKQASFLSLDAVFNGTLAGSNSTEKLLLMSRGSSVSFLPDCQWQ
ncbi:hypothetical protein AMECASPLE_035505 [Ameca splendens]|uniref:Uncharacterized protein n=1 Tax=Ameca splendens TaxID=208324 RepID=A0ABV0ZTI3_9TELE